MVIFKKQVPRFARNDRLSANRQFYAHLEKIENHGHAVALHYMHYNFCRVHQTLRVTPAMEAGIADHVWSLEEVVSLLEGSANIAA